MNIRFITYFCYTNPL